MPPSLRGTVEAIRSMQVRGAAAIGTAAARALSEHIYALDGTPTEVLGSVRKAARTLDAARPTAATLHNALGCVLQAVATQQTVAKQRRAATEAAARVATDADVSMRAIARKGVRHMPDGAVVLTHCHSSTVVAILEAARAAGKTIEVIATETRPFHQGLRTVKELHAAGIETAFIVDSAVQHVMATRDIDLVLVGADTVTRDGALFNKIGTAGVAALAQMHEIPFYSAAGLYKFSRQDSDDVPIEERPAREVAAASLLPRGVRVFNPVFDMTRADLVSSYITEDGLASPKKAVARNIPRLPNEEVWG